jgi:Flp pilus assembly protein TadG
MPAMRASYIDCRKKTRRGATLVEAAIVLPLVMMFLLGIMEYGRYFMTVQLFSNAVNEGARYAITHVQSVTIGGTTYGNSTTDVTNKMNAVLAGMTLASQSTSVYCSDAVGTNLGTWTNATQGQYITVKTTGNYQVSVLTMIGLPSTLPISVQSTKQIESQ